MSKLTEADVKKVAKLARLTLTDSETKTLKDQLSKVIDYISELDKVDTKNTQSTSQTTGLLNVLAPDKIDPLVNIPINNYFIVPSILKNDN